MFVGIRQGSARGTEDTMSSTCMTTLPLAWVGGLFTVFGVKLAVLNRASTGIGGKDQASDMGTPRV